MSEDNQLQLLFFEQLKEKISTHKLLANEISSALNISKSEAYNKISGNSSLTLPQLHILCNKYNFNFEVKPSANINNCNVRFTPFHLGKASISDYVVRMKNQMKGLQNAGIEQLTCSTDDIPFFHLFKYNELAAFKLHFWEGRIFTKRKNMPEQVFVYKNFDKKIVANAYELYKTYLQIPCTEIWTKNELLIIIEQLRYSIESKLLTDKKLIQTICEQILFVLDDIETYATQGFKSKTNSSTFNWFYCDVVGNVSYLAKLKQGYATFLRFNTFNNFESTDANICTEVNHWLNSLLNDAIGFSGHAGKYRNIYLQNLRRVIQDFYL